MNRNLYFLFGSQTLIIFSVVLVVFSMGIVAFNETQSLSSFSQIIICGYVPELIVGPFVGRLVDRFNRGRIIFVCNLMHFVIFSVIAAFIFIFGFQLSLVSIFVVFISLVAGIHRLAYNTILSVITDNPLNYPRLNGNVQSGIAIAHVIAPLLAGYVTEQHSLFDVICIAAIIALASMCLMFLVHCPDYCRIRETKVNFSLGFRYGFQTVFDNKVLFKLLLMHGAFNFSRSAAVVIFTPLILSIASETDLGFLRAVAGVGIGVGALLISKYPVPRSLLSRFYICIVSVVLCAVFIICIGLTHSLVFIGISVLLLFVLTPVLAGVANAIWLEAVPIRTQGRIFGFRDAIVGGCSTGAFIIAPWFAGFFHHLDWGLSMSDSLSFSYIVFGILLLTVALPQLFRFSRFASD